MFKAPCHSRAGLLRPFPFSPSAPGVAYHRSARWSDRRNRVRTTRQPHLDPLEERQLPSGYSVANMGSFGGTYGIVLGINSQGAAVGGSTTTNNAAEQAFVYSHGQITNLGTLGGTLSKADGINSAGEIVGIATTNPDNTQNAEFLYRKGHMIDLGAVNYNLPVGDFKINNNGEIIGLNMPNGDAALLKHGRTIDLGSLGDLGSAARGINDQGEIVGLSAISQSGSSEIVRAFLYEHSHMRALGTLGGSQSEANAINSTGEVVGDSTTADGSSHGFLYAHGHMTDLGTLGGTGSDAAGINDKGQIVGESLTSAGVNHAFIDSHGRMTDLNTLIPANSGFVIINAEDINDRGQIAALAHSTSPQDSTQYVVLLNPSGRG